MLTAPCGHSALIPWSVRGKLAARPNLGVPGRTGHGPDASASVMFKLGGEASANVCARPAMPRH